MDMLGKVRHLEMRDKLSISEIRKSTGLSRITIRGKLRALGKVAPKYERKLDARKLTQFDATLITALEAD